MHRFFVSASRALTISPASLEFELVPGLDLRCGSEAGWLRPKRSLATLDCVVGGAEDGH